MAYREATFDEWRAGLKAKPAPVIKRRRNPVVYFIRAASGPIKIGIALDAEKRLAGLQTAHYSKLTLAAVRKGGRKREIEYHARFAAHRLHGEWFAPHPDILAEIARLSPPHPEGAE